jgi:hypothetical protein
MMNDLLQKLKTCWDLNTFPKVQNREGLAVVCVNEFDFHYGKTPHSENSSGFDKIKVWIRHPQDDSLYCIFTEHYYPNGAVTQLFPNCIRHGKWDTALKAAINKISDTNIKRIFELRQKESDLREKFEALF